MFDALLPNGKLSTRQQWFSSRRQAVAAARKHMLVYVVMDHPVDGVILYW